MIHEEKHLPSTLKNDENFSVKELAKTLCTCHHKCHDTSDCVVEDEAKEVIANFATTTEKQIEEMAKAICEICKCDGDCDATICSSAFVEAESLYNAGYRKQSKGEWVAKETMIRTPSARNYTCSVCGCESTRTTTYCPNCGAKMKGGEE